MNLIALLMSAAVFAAPVLEERTLGEVYWPAEDRSAPKFKFERKVEREKDGSRKVTARYFDLDGKDLVIEEVLYRSEGSLERYLLQQKQINEEAGVSVRDGRVFYSLKKPNGALKNNNEELHENTVVIDQLIRVLQKQWQAILNNERVYVKFVVPSRMEQVSFMLIKDSELKYEGVPSVRVRMVPTNGIISLFVNPIFLTLERDGGHRIREVNGRLPIKRFHGRNDYSDIEGVLRFKY